MIQLLATLKAKEGEGNEVAGALREFSEAVRKEAGTLCWRLFKGQTEPERFFVLEAYEDERAFQAHASSEAFQSLVATLADKLEVPLEVTFLSEVVSVTKE